MEPRGPAWLRKILGDERFLVPVGVQVGPDRLASEDMKYFRGMKHLRGVWLCGADVTDSSLCHLRGANELKAINLDSTQITDAGLKELAQAVPNVARLSLVRTDVTDRGLAYLTKLPHISHLNLRDTKVTDEGIKHLIGLPRLERLSLNFCNVTDRALEVLQNSPLKGLEVMDTSVTKEGALAFRNVMLGKCRIRFSGDYPPARSPLGNLPGGKVRLLSEESLRALRQQGAVTSPTPHKEPIHAKEHIESSHSTQTRP